VLGSLYLWLPLELVTLALLLYACRNGGSLRRRASTSPRHAAIAIAKPGTSTPGTSRQAECSSAWTRGIQYARIFLWHALYPRSRTRRSMSNVVVRTSSGSATADPGASGRLPDRAA
jgi:hypothetical protein